MEMLINCLRGMKRKAHGAQKSRHIQKYVEVASTAQRSDSPAKAINQRFPINILNARRIGEWRRRDRTKSYSILINFMRA